MALLKVRLHPCFHAEMLDLKASPRKNEQQAAAQILVLLDLMRSHPGVRERLLEHYQTIDFSSGNGLERVDIKIIKALRDVADDSKYMTDAVRRIRRLSTHPADDYRVFYAPRNPSGQAFECEILGVFHRSVAYSPDTLRELQRRYQEPHI